MPLFVKYYLRNPMGKSSVYTDPNGCHLLDEFMLIGDGILIELQCIVLNSWDPCKQTFHTEQ